MLRTGSVQAPQVSRDVGDGTHCSRKQKYGLLLVASTTGNGDAPENAGRFVRYIKRCKPSERPPFRHCCFAVLGLGDTNYDQFCQTGKLLDKKLAELGGTRLRPVATADEATGLEDVVEAWTADILTDITVACQGGGGGTSTGSGTTDAGSTDTTKDATQNGDATAAVSETAASSTNTPVTPPPSRASSSISAKEQLPVVEEKKTADAVENGDPTAIAPKAAPAAEEALVPAAAAATTNQPSSSLGVQIVKSLLKNLDANNNKSSSSSALLFDVDPQTLPTLLSSRSSCELIDPSSHPNADDVLIGDGASSVSSGFHYTARSPYDSSLLRARYLTQTSTAAATGRGRLGPRHGRGTPKGHASD